MTNKTVVRGRRLAPWAGFTFMLTKLRRIGSRALSCCRSWLQSFRPHLLEEEDIHVTMGKLFYGSQTGTTVGVAHKIQRQLNGLVSQAKSIQHAQPHELAACDFLVLGGATYGDGELTDDWKRFWPLMDSINFAGKRVALFALGDQFGYSYTFVSAMKLLYDKVSDSGGQIIADCIPTADFEFAKSESVVDGCFIGLVIDEVNQPELTERRIKAWASIVRQQLALVCTA